MHSLVGFCLFVGGDRAMVIQRLKKQIMQDSGRASRTGPEGPRSATALAGTLAASELAGRPATWLLLSGSQRARPLHPLPLCVLCP